MVDLLFIVYTKYLCFFSCVRMHAMRENIYIYIYETFKVQHSPCDVEPLIVWIRKNFYPFAPCFSSLSELVATSIPSLSRWLAVFRENWKDAEGIGKSRNNPGCLRFSGSCDEGINDRARARWLAA